MTPVVLITGGASGIGRAIAERAVKDGARVVLWDADAVALHAALAALGDAARGQAIDISDPQAVTAADHDPGWFPTHLVNNAGILGRPMGFSDFDPQEFDRICGVNLRGTFAVTSAFLKTRAAHPSASVVNLASIAGFNGGAAGHAVYGATKGAILALTAAMARDLAPEVRVNALAPGLIDTEMQKTVFSDAQSLQAAASTIPLGRIGTPAEVADAAIWLLFGAAYVTGEVIRVAGGRK